MSRKSKFYFLFSHPNQPRLLLHRNTYCYDNSPAPVPCHFLSAFLQLSNKDIKTHITKNDKKKKSFSLSIKKNLPTHFGAALLGAVVIVNYCRALSSTSTTEPIPAAAFAQSDLSESQSVWLQGCEFLTCTNNPTLESD